MTHVTSELTVNKRDQIGTGSCQILSRSVHPISHNARASQTHTDIQLTSAKLNPTLGNGVWATFTYYSLQKGKGKVFPYSLPSVGPGADPSVQAVSPQVT